MTSSGQVRSGQVRSLRPLTYLSDLAARLPLFVPKFLLSLTELDHDRRSDTGAGLQLVVLARGQLRDGRQEVVVHHGLALSGLLPAYRGGAGRGDQKLLL